MSGSGIALRPRTTILKKYRGIQVEYLNKWTIVVQKRTDFEACLERLRHLFSYLANQCINDEAKLVRWCLVSLCGC
jgi:hypothetical protein